MPLDIMPPEQKAPNPPLAAVKVTVTQLHLKYVC